MIKQLLIVILLIVAGLLIKASTNADVFRVERAIAIKAPPEKIFPLFNDFHRFGSWSPWERLDPGMQRAISGPASGKGAVYEWAGNFKAGAGRMEIVESEPSSHVKMQFDFYKPIRSRNTAEYTLTPSGDSTRLTWVMYGPSPFASKVMQVFVTMDEMIGPDFEKGLAAMKQIAEKS